MKKQIITLIGSAISFVGISQIQLSATDFANQNDTLRISQSSIQGQDYTVTDTAYTWDFSQLVPQTQYLKQFSTIGWSSIAVQAAYGPFAPSEYKASYFLLSRDLQLDQLNQFLPVTLSDLNAYFKKSNDSITQIGYSVAVDGNSLPFKSDTIETRYRFPLNFGDTINTSGYTYIDLNPAADVKIKQHRSVQIAVDGYGTLITPFSTYEVLRLKRTINEVDSVYQTFFGTGSWFAPPPSVTTEYEWLNMNGKDAILKIVENTANGNTQVRSVEYQDIYRGLDAGVSENTLVAQVYPNPVSEKITIASETEINAYQIFDLKGKELMCSKNTFGNSFEIPANQLISGVYLLKLQSDSKQTTIRFIKE